MLDSHLPKTYDFKATEERIYAWWEKNGYFTPSNNPNRPGFDARIKPFVISIPPPNVTGELPGACDGCRQGRLDDPASSDEGNSNPLGKMFCLKGPRKD